jgi:predicted metal-binding protein
MMSMSKIKPAGVTAVPSPWRDVILVCRKCSKKLDGGFGPDGDESLGRALKHSLRRSGQRRLARVIETKCLGVCPRGAVTVLRDSRPGEMLAVPRGTNPALLVETDRPPRE